MLLEVVRFVMLGESLWRDSTAVKCSRTHWLPQERTDQVKSVVGKGLNKSNLLKLQKGWSPLLHVTCTVVLVNKKLVNNKLFLQVG